MNGRVLFALILAVGWAAASLAFALGYFPDFRGGVQRSYPAAGLAFAMVLWNAVRAWSAWTPAHGETPPPYDRP
jgi:hypothetical protein